MCTHLWHMLVGNQIHAFEFPTIEGLWATNRYSQRQIDYTHASEGCQPQTASGIAVKLICQNVPLHNMRDAQYAICAVVIQSGACKASP